MDEGEGPFQPRKIEDRAAGATMSRSARQRGRERIVTAATSLIDAESNLEAALQEHRPWQARPAPPRRSGHDRAPHRVTAHDRAGS